MAGWGANSVSRRRGVRNAARGDAPAGRATQKPAAVEAQGVSIIRALICKPGGIAAGNDVIQDSNVDEGKVMRELPIWT